jgi:hypothetical protein
MTRFRRPSLPLGGGCPCGAVRYELSEMPLLAYACHCTNCQRATGSAFALNMPVAARAFRVTQGMPRSQQRAGPSGVLATYWFCSDCGGRLYSERESEGARIVRAGTLDDTSWVAPAAHLFVRSAQPWERFSGAPCFDTVPSDYAPLVEAWQRRWREADPRQP